MLASVAASPVSWPGPWHARVRPASEPAFQPLMACGCFFTTVPGSGLPAGVSLLGLSVSPSRAVLLLVLPCLCDSVFVQKGSGDLSAVCSCPRSLRVPVRIPFLPLVGLCLHFPGPASLWCMFLSRSSRLVFVTIAVVPPALSSFPGTFGFG